MKYSMLDYCKLILRKVSFDKRLLKKEYRKSLQVLPVEESRVLRKWVKEQVSEHRAA
jgi:hypothetical protein